MEGGVFVEYLAAGFAAAALVPTRLIISVITDKGWVMKKNKIQIIEGVQGLS